MSNWIYNEFRHCGVDYSDARQAEIYDSRHSKFRNFEKEFTGMMDFLSLKDTHDMSLIDIGCGTGATLVYAAPRFRKVFAVDVSEVMIEQARRKISGLNIDNIEFIKAGFLTYEHKGERADLVVTKAAFHHLPDFWKQIALLNINKMLKPGGILYMFDVVFNFEPAEYKEKITGWTAGFEKQAGKEFRSEIEAHIRDEYSTFGWILEGMMNKAGFMIDKNRTTDGFISEYCCRKTEETAI